MEKIYLDNAATTRVCEQAAERVLYVMTQAYGNPSSLHSMGFEAEREMTAARQAVADRLSVNSAEVYFTSGGTEANNIALFGAVKRNGRRGKRIVTTAVEHPSVLRVMEQLERDGFTVEYLMPDATGHISSEQVERAITGDTILVSMMLVNNETGVRMPVEAAAEAIRRSKSPALLHVDAVQAFCKVPIKPARVGINLMTVSSHKIHGPKGAGALYVAGQKDFPSRAFGGGQEKEVRPGTEPLPAIAGFGAAVRAMPQPQELNAHFETLRTALREQLGGLSGVVIHSPEDAVPYVQLFSSGHPRRNDAAFPVLKKHLCLERFGLLQGKAEPCAHSHGSCARAGGILFAGELFPLYHNGRNRRSYGRTQAGRGAAGEKILRSLYERDHFN